jgi:ACS family tartrate transporter-like MFS transporter
MNSVGNLGAFVGPFAICYIKGYGESATPGLLLLAGCLVASFVMTLLMKVSDPRGSDEARGALANQSHQQ